MSADITHSKEFNTVCNFDTTHNNVANQDNTEVVIQMISKTCTSVIQHLQSSENKSDREKIAQFSQKVSIINGQFEAEGKGVPFAVHLYTLNLLTELKEKLYLYNSKKMAEAIGKLSKKKKQKLSKLQKNVFFMIFKCLQYNF